MSQQYGPNQLDDETEGSISNQKPSSFIMAPYQQAASATKADTIDTRVAPDRYMLVRNENS